jgi:hypothetical protein
MHDLAAPIDLDRRLNEAFAEVRTLDDAIAKFGPPDEDLPHGVSVRTQEESEKPSVVRSYRTIRYSRLSDIAEVYLVDYQRDRVSISYQGKYLKPDQR